MFNAGFTFWSRRWWRAGAPALHHLFLYQDPPLSHPLIGSSQLWAKHFPYLYPSSPILGITSMLNACEDGMASKYQNVGTKSSDTGRLPKRHNTVFNTCWKFEIKILYGSFLGRLCKWGRMQSELNTTHTDQKLKHTIQVQSHSRMH